MGARDGEGPLRYGMASRLVVMGPAGLVFDGVILTPSIAFPRQVLVIAQAQPLVPTPCYCARDGTLRGGGHWPSWHGILSRSLGSYVSSMLSVFPPSTNL